MAQQLRNKTIEQLDSETAKQKAVLHWRNAVSNQSLLQRSLYLSINDIKLHNRMTDAAALSAVEHLARINAIRIERNTVARQCTVYERVFGVPYSSNDTVCVLDTVEQLAGNSFAAMVGARDATAGILMSAPEAWAHVAGVISDQRTFVSCVKHLAAIGQVIAKNFDGVMLIKIWSKNSLISAISNSEAYEFLARLLLDSLQGELDQHTPNLDRINQDITNELVQPPTPRLHQLLERKELLVTRMNVVQDHLQKLNTLITQLMQHEPLAAENLSESVRSLAPHIQTPKALTDALLVPGPL